MDENMPDSQIGGRRGKNIRNHLFMVYGIINSVLQGESGPVDISVYDIRQCFDSIWLEEAMNDLYETVDKEQRDNKLALVYLNNRDNRVQVNTPVGETERTSIQDIVLQGSVHGPALCSCQMGQLGKICKKKVIHQFHYKKLVKVMNLQMVDDLLDIQECGFKSVASNTFINTQIEMKRLTLHKDKCKQIHVGEDYSFCPTLKVHDSNMKSVTQDKYLGDEICNNIYGNEGSNYKNIKVRKSAGLGINAQIMTLLQTVSLGYFYFDIAALLRESMLVGGCLFNSEVWYGLTQHNISELEEVDKALLRRILEAPISVPGESLFLELGLTPIKYIVMGRRVMYLHYLVNLKKEEMLHQFFIAQWENPAKNDWTETVKKDLECLGIKCDLKEIQKKKKEQFREMVKRSIKSVAFNYLMELKRKHSKMNNLQYTELKQQNYLSSKLVPPYKAKSLFRFRVRADRVKCNYKNSYSDLSCPLCLVTEDKSEHLLDCVRIKEKCVNVRVNATSKYMDIFSSSIEKMIAAVDLLDTAMKVRESLLDEQVH